MVMTAKKDIGVSAGLPDITSIIAEVMEKYASALIESYGDDTQTAHQANVMTRAWLDVELERGVKLYYKKRYHD